MVAAAISIGILSNQILVSAKKCNKKTITHAKRHDSLDVAEVNTSVDIGHSSHQRPTFWAHGEMDPVVVICVLPGDDKCISGEEVSQ